MRAPSDVASFAPRSIDTIVACSSTAATRSTRQAGRSCRRVPRSPAALKSKGMTSPSTIDVLSADEVAALLNVDRKTIYGAADRNAIPHRRLGRRLLFERGAVLRWLAGDGATAPPGAAADPVPIARRSRRGSARAKRLRQHGSK